MAIGLHALAVLLAAHLGRAALVAALLRADAAAKAVALLAESHISIPTWPENGMAVCDVFTCGEHTNPRSGATYMYEAMGATDLVSEIFTRPLK